MVKLVFKKSDKIFLKGQHIKLPMRLVDKEVNCIHRTLFQVVTHDTTLFTFGLPSVDYVLGLPVGMH